VGEAIPPLSNQRQESNFNFLCGEKLFVFKKLKNYYLPEKPKLPPSHALRLAGLEVHFFLVFYKSYSAFTMSIASVITTTSFTMKLGRFGNTINRAFLWYGTLLLISTIAIFVFDCLPEVFARVYRCRSLYCCNIYPTKEVFSPRIR